MPYSKEELKNLEKKFKMPFLENQSNSGELYEKLNMSFGPIEKRKSSDYLDNYGGAYINDDGKLVIYITEEVNTNKAMFIERIGTKDVLFEPCKFSFRTLTEIIDDLNEFKMKKAHEPICSNFNVFLLDDVKNRIIVELDEHNEEQITAFRNHVLDSPAIEFVKSKGKVVKEVNVNAGARITRGLASASNGYRARLSGQNGIITAGHFANLNQNISFGGTIFARSTRYQESGPVDASFCLITNSNYTPTNTINTTTNTLSTTISEPGAGTVINKQGATTLHTSGRVLSTNVSVTLDGIHHTNLTSADYQSGPGDSGCVVYSYIGSTGARLTLGIHCAAQGNTRYYIKANQINSAFGTSRY